MAAKLDADSDGHDQVDEGDGVEADAEDVHGPGDVDQGKEYDDESDGGREEVDSRQQGDHGEDGGQANAEGAPRVTPYGEVLLVEHVEQGVREHSHL